MKLVFCWIPEYLNIKKQGLNFGSAYIYKADFKEEENRLIINRTNNEKYQPDFFKIEGVGFENVTAIVGENGAGKTNLLEYIGKLLVSSIQTTFERTHPQGIPHDEYNKKIEHDGILVFEDGDNLYIRASDNIEIETNLKYKSWNENDNHHSTIYFSPLYDFRIETTEYNGWINISSNALIKKDTNSLRKQYTTAFDPIFSHKTQEIRRQLLFLKSLSDELKSRISERIYIPDKVNFTLSEITLPIDKEVEKLPESLLESIFSDEKTAINSKRAESYSPERRINPSNELAKNREIISRWELYNNFLHSLFGTLLKNAERSLEKKFENENFTEGINKIKLLDFENLNYEKCEESNYERAFKTFFEFQTLFNYQELLVLTDTFKKEILNLDNKSWRPYNTIQVSKECADVLLQNMEKIVSQPTKYSDMPMTFDFIDFHWEGMSSGEIAFLNIFSRLNDVRADCKKVESIYLLIDEGEAGFHFQWQKEYIKNLITIIPHIFEKKIPIQLIFATHSPITLSDIPNHHITFLKKKNQGETEILDNGKGVRHTFGANIHDILYDGFFMQDGFMGSFAVHKINEVFNRLERLLEEQRKLRDQKIEALQIVPNDLKIIVSNIDEDLIRRKLEEKIAQIEYGDTKAAQVASLEAQKKHIEEQINKLKNDTDN